MTIAGIIAACISLSTSGLNPLNPTGASCQEWIEIMESPEACANRIGVGAAFDKSGWLDKNLDRVIAERCLTPELYLAGKAWLSAHGKRK